MKKMFLILLTMFSVSAMAVAPMAKMESSGGGVLITFTNFADLGPFEKYNCNVDFGNWIYTLDAQSTGTGTYTCFDQGGLNINTSYNVYFTFKEWPSDAVLQSATFSLKAE